MNQVKFGVKLLFALFLCLAIWSCNHQRSTIIFSQTKDKIIIENHKIRAVFTKTNDNISQEYYSIKDNDWIKVASAFIPPSDYPEDAVQLFNQDLVSHRYLSNSNLSDFKLIENEKGVTVLLNGSKGNVPIDQSIFLGNDSDHFHFSVKMELPGSPAKLDYLLSTFEFNSTNMPSFVHTPVLKFDNEDSHQNRFKILPGKDQIIGDRAFHAPAVIVQDNNLFAAVVPDLKAINEYKIISPDARRMIDIPINRFSIPIENDKYTMPTGLDFDVMTGLSDKPLMSYGYMDNIIGHHIRYQRVNDSTMIRTLDSNKVQYEFDLFIGADIPYGQGFRRISRFQWNEYGNKIFKNRPHLAMPFEEYFHIIDSITFHSIKYNDIEIDLPLKGYKDDGSWLEWEENGKTLGGYRSAIDWWNDVLHNSAFWNNARDAKGFWYWGKRLNRPDLVQKSQSIINWCLSAPRSEQGLFALLYSANDKKWSLGFTDPVNGKNQFFLRDSDSYDVSTMSKTAAHLIDYYLSCEKDSRIVEYLIPYGNWLLSVIDERGALPSYVDSRDMKISPILYYSAQPSSSMWFLSELYRATNNEEYLQGAKKIADYLQKEIIPEQKWIDMEQFFSCGNRPFEFKRDRWQNQVARGNLSTFWAIEGFASLYKATQNKDYLKSGETCIDYVSFFQCVWNPHYIYTAFPFGGFSSDNADNANFLDARQAEMVRSYIWYGKTLGRQDLLERGVAAARASVVLINHPRHKANGIYPHTNIYPFGLGPENIDHEASPQSAMRTHPSWGEGSGVFTGLAEALRGLGGIYIDFGKNLFVGVDGIRVDEATIEGDKIHLKLTNMLNELKLPWQAAFTTNLRFKGLEKKEYRLIINGIETKHVWLDSDTEIPITFKKDNVNL